VLAVCALLTALGAWTYHAVETSLREVRAGNLRSLLDSEVNALRVWIAEQMDDAQRIARDPRVGTAVEQLLRAPACSGPARERVEQALQPVLRESGESTFNITARNGRLLATRFPEYCGLALNAQRFLPRIEPVFDGKAVFVPPFLDADRVSGALRLRDGPAFAWVVAPVRDARGKVIAALGIAEPIDGVFGSILRAASPGESGAAFAFDERGTVVSAEHFGSRTPLHDARDTAVLEPYLGHRGIEVIGASRWLPEYGMGVALEIGMAEAYAPMHYLNIAFGVVFGALVIAAFAALGSALSFARLRRQVGEKLGPYRLQDRIGEGGMATVYLAQHALLKRPTAIKLLKSTHTSDEMVARFAREAKLASSLAHPNTVEIFDYGRTRDGRFYYAMEYLDGLSLGQILLREKFLPVARTVHILRQVCAALGEAHAKGLVHRDIKPENIMVCRYGGQYDFAKILDFGLVKQLSSPHSRDLTRSLRILGTPLYMAPERLRNPADVDARADIYSVGAVAFLMLTGRRLFETADDLELTTRVLNDAAPRAAAAAPQAVPPELDRLVAACLEKRREDRPQRVAELGEALDALALEHRWSQKEAAACWPPTSSARTS
jgi:tRNA A-37 threonylcarbamoyl transferase component Bud32